ncbi:CPBP family intramembrane metalloprotease [Crenobacter sp. SG2305]|uniref:CPBP family intramembrane glutamic endopeptidase n=1 Tax=Crenobacter oryzisoli TaxID=3056844 RepID=UPI0025AB444C|nr:CPBP family intramembrane glutamic endopeptidase [Crenobacter sp. SG2305]MDN0084595.1 CPBP family intramembrane metalloprotease [Crenobacter sp. SG2305]
MPVTAWPWLAIFPAVALLLMRPDWRRVALSLLGLGYAAALVVGLLDLRALASLMVLGAAAWLVGESRPRWQRAAGHALFVAVAFGLALHGWPGFHNPPVYDGIRFSSGAVPFSMYLNLDKPLIGVWLLLVWRGAQRRETPERTLVAALGYGGAATLACLGLALLLGVVGWAPKWPVLGWLWALNNLLLVCVAEEALFRGYLQAALERAWGERRFGGVAALFLTALLFGLVHLPGGAAWVVLATLAGVGYGLAYRQGGLPGAVLAHFGLNLVHFGLFSYPMLGR